VPAVFDSIDFGVVAISEILIWQRSIYFGYALTNLPRKKCSKCGNAQQISKK